MKNTITTLVLIFTSLNLVFSQGNVKYINVKTANSTSYFRINLFNKIEWESNNINNVNIYVCAGVFNYYNETVYDTTSIRWDLIAGNIPASQMYYDWNVTEEYQNALIKVESYDDTTVYDISNMTFSTYDYDNGINILYPKGNEIYQVGDFYNKILFRKTGNPQIKVQLSTDGKNSWNNISNMTYWGYDYTSYSPMPLCPLSFEILNDISNDCYIRILDYQTDSVFDETNIPFAIQNSINKSLKLTSQMGSSNICYTGNNCVISWDYLNVNNINIEYTIDDLSATSLSVLNNEIQWTTLVSNYGASNNSYSFLVDNSLNDARFKISDAQDSTVYDIAESTISVSDIGKLRIIYPQGGEILDTTSNYNKLFIKSLSMMSPITLEISYDSLQTWFEIEDVQYMGMEWPYVYGHFSPIVWATPNILTNNCFIRVRDMSNPSIIYDTIPQKIRLATDTKKIEIISQRGAMYEYCQVDSALKIKWVANNVSQVKIEKCNMTNIVANEVDLNTPYIWEMVANNVTATDSVYELITTSNLLMYRFKITDINDTSVYDITEAAIYPVGNMQVDILYPKGDEVFLSDSLFYNILWKTLNTSGINTEFQLSSDNGVSWIPIQAIYNNNEMQYVTLVWTNINWKIPQVNSDSCLLRIVNKSSGEILHTTQNNFSIKYFGVTNIEKESLENQYRFSLFPNPSNGNISINSSKEIEFIRIYDINGRTVFESKKELKSFNLNLKKGVYVFSVVYKDRIIDNTKLIIK